MTNLNHLDAEFDEKSKPIPFAVSKGTNEYSGQSEHRELMRPLTVLTTQRGVHDNVIRLQLQLIGDWVCLKNGENSLYTK